MMKTSADINTSSSENSEVVTVTRRVRVNITGSIDKFKRNDNDFGKFDRPYKWPARKYRENALVVSPGDEHS